MDDPSRTFASPRWPSSVLVFRRFASLDIHEWGHLLPASERRTAFAVLECHARSPRLAAVPKDLILRHVLPYVLDGGADDRAGAAERFERLLETEAVLGAQAEAARRAHGSLASPWWTRYRRAVVDSLHGLAEKCDLDLSVAHHAVRLIDLLWLLPNARDDALRWVARTMREHAAYLCVAALRASARLHRAPVPDDGAFARHVPDLFSKQCQNSDWRTCERYIDLHLGWRVLCVTPLHCLQHFIALKPLYARAAGELEGPRDFHRDAPVTPDKFDRLYLYVQKWCAFFCSLCLQHHKFSAIQPSLLASAILHVARLNLKLSPPWRPELEAMTHHTEDAIQPTASEILQLYHDEFPQFGRP